MTLMKEAAKGLKNSLIKSIVNLSRKLDFPKRNLSHSIARFLVVSTTGIGDTLWGTPAIRALRETFPQGYIGVLSNPLGFEVLKGNPDINDIFVFKRGFFGFFSLPGLLKRLRNKHIDIVFILHASDRVIWPFCFFTGANEIIGKEGDNKGLDFIHTRSVSAQGNVHGIEARLNLVREMGADTSNRAISFHLTDSDREKAERFLNNSDINKNSLIIGLHPGAQKPFKCWPAKNFIEAGNILVEKFGCRIMVTGDSREKTLTDNVVSKIRGAISVAGKLTLRETAALIDRMGLFVTNDTGPMHIAFAVGTPTIALFCPTDSSLCGPYHVKRVVVIEKPMTCNPCVGKKCINPFCMEQITVEEVIDSAEALFVKGAKRPDIPMSGK